MKALLVALLVGLAFVGSSFAKDVFVNGYFRKDGTYVKPHHRSSPDGDVSNNYGRASSQQRQQYQSLPVVPSYNNDYNNDGVQNRYSKDDDNDGVLDKQDAGQYSTQNSGYNPWGTQQQKPKPKKNTWGWESWGE